MAAPIAFTPIGVFRGQAQHSYEAPRQAVLAHQGRGCIELAPGRNFEQALQDLAGFERIWVIFLFDRNQHWKPLARPPRGDRKVGVFACRSPYRPNPIGLSCVELLDIDGLRLTVRDHDLLDGTPILDLKPYIPYCDSFPQARAGWLDQCQEETLQVDVATLAAAQLDWLAEHGVKALRSFLQQQLATRPTDARRKRLQARGPDRWEIAYRTWRILFRLDADQRLATVETIRSAYTAAELADHTDRYADKPIHRAFATTWNTP